MTTTSPNIRLVAVDLDGTLLNDSKQVTRQTVCALACLPGQGVRVVIASARPPRSVRAIYQLLRLDTLQINYNGGLIWDEANQRPFFHQPMPGELASAIIDHARTRFAEVLVSCEILDRWCTDRDDHTYTTETGKLFKPDFIGPVATFCQEPVTKLMLLGHPSIIAHFRDDLTRVFADRVSILSTDPDLLQIMDNRASKATALAMIANHYAIGMNQILAIGDAPNDIEMLRESGVAVAMDNAHPLVKAVADWIAPSNNDHGVHAALLRYGLCAAG